MGKVASRLTKPIRTFNIENRAWRALDKQHKEGIASPKHPSSVTHISKAKEDFRESFSVQQQKNEDLHEKLKGLFVENEMTQQKMSSSRPLPESRKANPETDLGTMDTFHTIPEGKANLKTVLSFISQHQIDPVKTTPEIIAKDYTLDVEDVRKVLNHFKAFNLHIPQEMYKQNSNLKKIVADQINSASANVNQLKLTTAKEDDSSDVNLNKT